MSFFGGTIFGVFLVYAYQIIFKAEWLNDEIKELK
jgi:hypothetical protein